MKVNIPLVVKTLNDKNEVVKTPGTLSADVDTSFYAHLKWEEQFQSQLKCDLTHYQGLVSKWVKKKDTSDASLLGMLRLMYCFIDSPDLPDFKSFTKLMDTENTGPIMEILSKILQAVEVTASKN